jgi:hypothetical protein
VVARLLAVAGACLWVLAMFVLAQRQRVLARRIARLERSAGVRRRRPGPELHIPLDGMQRTRRLLVDSQRPLGRPSVVVVPPVSDRPPKPPPAPQRLTVQQLAALARPLQRAGG